MSDKIELNRRRVLGGLVTIGAAGAAVGAGTFAAFSDTEESTGNTVTAGTIDLTVNGTSDIESASITAENVEPGWSDSYSLNLGNDGSLGGDLWVKFEVTDSTDNEIDDDSTGLEDDLNLTYTNGAGDTSSVSLNAVTGDWHNTEETIGANVTGDQRLSRDIGLELSESVGNEAQGESVTIDFSMQLIQSGESP